MMLKYWASQSVLSVAGKDGNRNLYNEVDIAKAIQWSSNRRSDRARHASHCNQKKMNPDYSGPQSPKIKDHRPRVKQAKIVKPREPAIFTPREKVIKFVPHESIPSWAREMRELARSFRR